MVSLSADREAYGPEEAARWLAVSRFSSAILQLCQPIAVSAGQHMAWATMIQRVIWLSHTAVQERERASLVQGPLAPDGLFGPRFSEVLAHQQSVREDRSRFGTILTGSSRQQAERKRGLGRSQRSMGPPPTPAPVQQPQPPRTGRAAAPRTGKFRTLAPTFSFPIKEKSKDRSAERQYMVPKERYSPGHLRPTLVVRSSMLPLSPSQPGGCRVAVGRRVHMASGSPASKKRRPLEPRGRIRDSLHGLLVPHIIGEEMGPRAVATACGQRMRTGAAAGRLAPCSAGTSATSRQLVVFTTASCGTSPTLAEPPPFRGKPPLVHTQCEGGRGRGIRVIPGRSSSAVGSPSLQPLCVLARAVRSAIVVGHHVEMGPSHTVQASSPTLYGVGGDHATGPGCEHGSGSRGGTSLGKGGHHCRSPPRVSPRFLFPLLPGFQEVRGNETYSGSSRVQQIRCHEEVQNAHGRSIVPVCERGRLVHIPGSQGCLLPRPCSAGAQEVSPLCLYGDGVRVPVSAVRLFPGAAHLLEVCGDGVGTAQTSGKEDSLLPRRSAYSEQLRRDREKGHHVGDKPSLLPGFCHQLGEELPAPQPADSLLGALPRLSHHDCDAFASSARRHPVGALPFSRSQKRDRTVHHAPVGADGSCPPRGPPGSAFYAQTPAVVCSPTVGPQATQAQGAPRPPFGVARPGILERTLRPSQGCSTGQGGVLRSGLHGRLVDGLGRNVPLSLGRRRVAHAPYSTHKCVGARRCEESAVAFLSPGARPPRSDQDRQRVGGGVHQQTGGSPLPCSPPKGGRALALGSSVSPQSESPAYRGRPELWGGPHVSRRSPPRRVAVTSRHCQTDLAEVRDSAGGPLRVPGEHALQVVVLPQPSGSSPVGGRCVGTHTLAAGSLVCVSPAPADPSSSGTGQTGETVPDISGPGEPCSSVVSRACRALAVGALASTIQAGCAFTGPRDGAPPARCLGTAVGLAPERLILQGKGLPETVINTIQSARAPSTSSLYAAKWCAFSNWCETNHAVPSQCEVGSVLSFLQNLLEKGLAFSTIKVYAAAVSAGHAGCDGGPIFSHPLVKRFLRGARRVRPVSRVLTPRWDLPTVLRGLSRDPFEPLSQAPLDALSFKTALLLALVSAKRAGELTALSVSPSCLLLNEDSSFALLRPNPAFLPKNINSSFRSRDIVLKAFHPPPHSSEAEAELHLLCPVRALAMYVNRSAAFRSTQQLFVCYSDASRGRALSKQRFSRWVCEGVCLAYSRQGLAPPLGVKAHSTRSVAASTALLKGVSVEDICAAASWSSPGPFVRFYMLDMSRGSLGNSVLESGTPFTA